MTDSVQPTPTPADASLDQLADVIAQRVMAKFASAPALAADAAPPRAPPPKPDSQKTPIERATDKRDALAAEVAKLEPDAGGHTQGTAQATGNQALARAVARYFQAKAELDNAESVLRSLKGEAEPDNAESVLRSLKGEV